VRDASKLLVVKGNSVSEARFTDLPSLLSAGQFLIFNDTRVIRARLLFSKPSGGKVEIFCLDPVEPAETESAFHARGQSVWKCLVGNSKRWKDGELEMKGCRDEGIQGCRKDISLKAGRGAALTDGAYEIRFSWEPEEMTFAEMLETLGHIPLPPYIHRDDTAQDRERYQTIYAAHDGSVAAPTAGLHFTPSVLESLKQKGCGFGYVTLHVGAGTFRPVTEAEISRHVMHSEKIGVPIRTIREILEKRDNGIVAVGTTASRTLESLYWAGVKLIVDGDGIHPEVSQWDPYTDKYNINVPLAGSLQAVIRYLEANGLPGYHGETRLMILPGYRFRLADGLLTNFHMPGSTLLMLVSAFAGEVWKEAYRFALERDFRFLSYGDACLFLK
jgi:S-adenosylmethionine:tRNA ribosyltransferase-isomerase